jgi:hypothetical protein
MVESE